VRFKTGFLIGAAVGAWAARKAGSAVSSSGVAQSLGGDEAAEKLRALSGLAKERLGDIMDGPLGAVARERFADLIGASIGNKAGSSSQGKNGSPIDASARWPD
jgi:hypothetical protein